MFTSIPSGRLKTTSTVRLLKLLKSARLADEALSSELKKELAGREHVPRKQRKLPASRKRKPQPSFGWFGWRQKEHEQKQAKFTALADKVRHIKALNTRAQFKYLRELTLETLEELFPISQKHFRCRKTTGMILREIQERKTPESTKWLRKHKIELLDI